MNRIAPLLLVLIAAVAGYLYFSGAPSEPVVQAPSESANPAEESTPAPAVSGTTNQATAPTDAERQVVAAAGIADASLPCLVGQVVGADGKPVGNATVYAADGFGNVFQQRDWNDEAFDFGNFGERMREAMQAKVSVTTDEQGRFRIRPPGSGERVAVRLLARGYAMLDKQAARPKQQDVDLGTLQLDGAAIVSGRVVDAAGNGIEGASVTRIEAMEANFAGFDFSMPGQDTWEELRGGDRVVTDSRGYFELAHVKAGEFHLRARHPDRPSAQVGPLQAKVGQALENTMIALRAGATLRGIVHGIPKDVRNIKVSAAMQRDNAVLGTGQSEGLAMVLDMAGDFASGEMGMSFGERQTDVDGEGRFALRGLDPEKTYRVWAVQTGRGFLGDGLCTKRVTVAPTANVELAYEAGVTVTLQVVDAAGKPVEKLDVRDQLQAKNAGDWQSNISFEMFGGRVGGRSRLREYPEGQVTVANLRPKKGQTLSLTIGSVGYASWQRDGIELPEVGALDLGKVQLAAVPVLVVTVLDASTRQPVRGASVQLQQEEQRGRAGRTRSDEQGVARLNAPGDQAAKLSVTAKDYAAQEVALAAGAELACTVLLTVGGELAVLVVDADQQPVANQAVERRGPDAARDERTTNEQGIATWEHLVPGTHRVRLGGGSPFEQFAFGAASRVSVSIAGGEAMEPPAETETKGWQEVVVTDAGKATCQLAKAATAQLTGIVRENGLPLADARVTFVTGEGGGTPDRAAVALSIVGETMAEFGQGGNSEKTKADGRYSLKELTAGAHRVRVTHKSRAVPTEVPVTLRIGENQLDIELDMTSVAGVVRGPDGAPIAGARVSAREETEATAPHVGAMIESLAPGMNVGGTQVKTDANGEFELRGVPTNCKVTVRATSKGFSPASVEVTVAPGEQRRGVEIKLSAGGKIVVQVSNASGPFAVVTAQQMGPDGPIGAPVVQMLRRGKATLSDLPPGEYEVVFRGPQDLQQGGEAGSKQRVTVAAGATANVEF